MGVLLNTNFLRHCTFRFHGDRIAPTEVRCNSKTRASPLFQMLNIQVESRPQADESDCALAKSPYSPAANAGISRLGVAAHFDQVYNYDIAPVLGASPLDGGPKITTPPEGGKSTDLPV